MQACPGTVDRLGAGVVQLLQEVNSVYLVNESLTK